MAEPISTDFWVGIISTPEKFKQVERKFYSGTVTKDDVWLFNIQNRFDTYAAKMVFAIDMSEGGNEDHKRAREEVKYRRIPVLTEASALQQLATIF